MIGGDPRLENRKTNHSLIVFEGKSQMLALS